MQATFMIDPKVQRSIYWRSIKRFLEANIENYGDFLSNSNTNILSDLAYSRLLDKAIDQDLISRETVYEFLINELKLLLVFLYMLKQEDLNVTFSHISLKRRCLIMYCEKLQLIKADERSSKYLIDDLTIFKLDWFLKNNVTLIERQNINPVRLAIEKNLDYETALMTFIIGTRIKLFTLRIFFECECGENMELSSTNEQIECDCGYFGNYSNSKESIKLYFSLLEKPINCDNEPKKNGEADYLDNRDLELFDNSFSSVEKVGGSVLVKEINEECLISMREAQMRDFLGDKYESL